MTSPEKLQEVAAKAKNAIQTNSHGWKNEDALREMRTLCSEMRFHAGVDAYASEKIVGLLSSAEILYSSRKHQKYDTPNESGADRVKFFCYSYASSIESWAKERASAKSENA